MRISLRHGGAVGMLAAAFGLLGPVAAQAGQIPGTSVPTCAGTCDLKAPGARLPGIAGTSIVLTSVIKRSLASNGYGRERPGLPGQRDRILQRSDRCGWWDGEWWCGDFDFDHYHHHHFDHYYRHHDYDHYYRASRL